MTAATRLVSASVVLLFALALNARAQTMPVEVETDHESARFSATGKVRMMQVEVYGPGGEMVFVSGFAEGRAVEWSQRDQSGQRVADGVYTAAVTIVDASGELRKRVERVVVGRDAQAAGFANAPNPTPQAPAALTGEGTAGKIAKFTSAYQLANSVIAESAGKVGVGTTAAPTAILEINGPQPGPQPATGTDATPLLKTIGGKGGNTTTAGEIAGSGASITLLAGPGGNAHQDSTNGSGGSITLQGGLKGTGGTGGVIGNVLLAPLGGNVGIGLGTGNPTARLTVKGVSFPHLISAENTTTSSGGVAVFGKNLKGYGVYGVGGGNAAGVYGENIAGFGVWGKGIGFSFGVVGESTGSGRGVSGESSSGYGIFGKSATGVGIRGEGPDGEGVVGTGKLVGVEGISSTGKGVLGRSTSGYAGYFEGVVGVTGTVEIGGTALFGSDARQMIILHTNGYGIGVQTSTHYFRTNGGFAWYKGGLHNDTANSPGTGGTRLMKLDSAGNLTATSFNPTSDRNAKSNFGAIDSRAILDKLNSLPIQTWTYKAEGDSVRHIGPVAQDFRAAFQLGADDKTISTVDADGVTMAAVQGLYQMMLEKEKRLEQQARQIEQLQSRVMQLERASKRGRKRRR